MTRFRWCWFISNSILLLISCLIKYGKFQFFRKKLFPTSFCGINNILRIQNFFDLHTYLINRIGNKLEYYFLSFRTVVFRVICPPLLVGCCTYRHGCDQTWRMFHKIHIFLHRSWMKSNLSTNRSWMTCKEMGLKEKELLMWVKILIPT